jgi:hypothetical protein
MVIVAPTLHTAICVHTFGVGTYELTILYAHPPPLEEYHVNWLAVSVIIIQPWLSPLPLSPNTGLYPPVLELKYAHSSTVKLLVEKLAEATGAVRY